MDRKELKSLLHELAAAASPLQERLSGLWIAGDSCVLAEDRWQIWAKKSSEELLERQLKIQGLTPESVKPLLGKVQLAPDRKLPSWTTVLSEALQEADQIKDWRREAEGDSVLRLCQDTRWRMFILPFLHVARRRMGGRDVAVLAPSALEQFERILVQRLCAIASPSLDLDFALWAAMRPAFGLSALFPEQRAAKFIHEAWREASFFRNYPVAARMCGVLVELWISFLAEFAGRFASDRAALGDTMFGGEDPGSITGLDCALSDPHEGGRSVLIAHFSGNRKLVYKPRSVGMEAAYFGFVGWVNAAGFPIHFQQLRILERGTHGWMEFAPATECTSREEAVRFFERGGALLAVLHALAGSDMHLENLIACGEHPVPVDLEVLMTPELESVATDPTRAASLRMANSVLSVGLLPQWLIEGKGKISNIGALGLGSEHTPGESPREAKHLPKLNGSELSSGDFVPEILRGYEAAYRFLLARREDLLRADGPLAAFPGRTLRHVHRPTSLYARMIVNADQAELQRDGALRSIELDTCIRTMLLAEDAQQANLAAIGQSEVQALEQRDVPYFTVCSDSRHLGMSGGGSVPNFFALDGLSVSRQRITALSEQDLLLQKKLIQSTYDLMARQPSLPADGGVLAPVPVSLRDEVHAMASRICDEALVTGNTVTWIAPVLIPETEVYQLSTLHPGLYEGTSGILIFLLAAARHLGVERFHDVARSIIRGLEELRSASRTEVLKRKSATGVLGVGGLVYTLVLASRLDGDSRLVSLAEEFATDAAPAISQDTNLDIMGGAAGVIPAFLALHSVTGQRQWLEAATACGDRLLETMEATPNSGKSWKNGIFFLSGYSHGAAGFAASLLRLFAATRQVRFRHAADEAIAYENSLFVAAEQNWKDLRSEEGEYFMAAWCHGAPGIGLGRILGLPGRDDATVRTDIDTALATTINTPLFTIDHCCCGNAGRADILLTASSRLDRPDCRDAADELLGKTVAKAKRLGGYICYGQLPAAVQGPGFFQGLSGIGYTMLRAEHPELPSVLAMEL